MQLSDIESGLRREIEAVKSGKLSRRDFIHQMVLAGLTAPMAAQLLMHAGVAHAQQYKSAYKPSKRGGGGPLRVLWWQGPTLLNPHFATGTKDQEGSRIFYEPLAAWEILAAEVPSVANKTVAPDGKWVIWKLKQGVKWHDGKAFTADDVVFTAAFAADPASAAVTIATYKDVKVTKVDTYTVRVENSRASPFWADPLVGTAGMIIPKHLFEAYVGAKSREAPTNLKPVGTGPYKFVDFKPGDMVRGAINTDYHEPNRPFFDSIEMKGGGDAVSAARAVLQTGEFDYAWNLQVEDEVLKRLETGGKGKTTITVGGNIEFIQLNSADPWTETEGERAHPKSRHPILNDPAVRSAMSMLVDKQSIQNFIYGRTGIATANFLNNPSRFVSKNAKYEFNPDKAAATLEAAGWKKGSIKQAAQKAGIDLELKSVAASVFFSSDVANPDTYTKFFCDVQMYTTTMTQPDPELFMNQFVSTNASSKANKWQGRNITRWVNAEYDATHQAAESEQDPVKRAAMFVKMNDLAVGDYTVIPVVARPRVAGMASKLNAPLSAWDNDLWMLRDWYREA
ncbi:MAG: peptide ABC transporter substrate-binding protein [Betaproteobacteria bacterium]|nr:peptide ABC transporter substrate-binding protein [Betaproteobacteria bacterium]